MRECCMRIGMRHDEGTMRTPNVDEMGMSNESRVVRDRKAALLIEKGDPQGKMSRLEEFHSVRIRDTKVMST